MKRSFLTLCESQPGIRRLVPVARLTSFISSTLNMLADQWIKIFRSLPRRISQDLFDTFSHKEPLTKTNLTYIKHLRTTLRGTVPREVNHLQLLLLDLYNILRMQDQFSRTNIARDFEWHTNLFNGIFDDVPMGNYMGRLTQPVDPIQCLLFGHGIPLRFHQMYAACGGKIQTMKLSEGQDPLLSFKGRITKEKHHTQRRHFRSTPEEQCILDPYGKI